MTQDYLLASKKRRKELGAVIHESAAAPVSEKARNLMAKMGWTENTGLGKRRDGIVTHIRAVKRVEQAGLGVSSLSAEQQQHISAEWWKDTVGSTLAKLGSSSSKKSSKKEKKRKRESQEKKLHYTDEELFEATGGKRFGMRAAPTSNLHKWKRTNDNNHVPGMTVDKDEDSKTSAVPISETTSSASIDSNASEADNELFDATEGVKELRQKKDKKEKKSKKAKKEKKRSKQ